MNKVSKSLEDKIINHVRFHFTKIDVGMGSYVANARCHHNSKQMLEEKKCDAIAMVVLIDRGQAIAHFIPVKDGVYIENTVGYMCKDFDYYLIKHLHSSETKDMNKMLGLFKKELLRSSLNMFELFLFKILGLSV